VPHLDRSSPFEQARDLGSGAIAGVVAVLVFTVLHQILINPIWWMFPIMAVAGAVCGLCVVWCYTVLVSAPSRRTWWGYISMYLVMFGLLTVASMILYDPVITIAEMLASPGGNPLPMSDTLALMAAVTVGWAGLMTRVYRGGWRGFGASLVTVTVLMLLLGFNLSTVGLVAIRREGWILLAEFFGYVVVLGGTFGLVHAGLVRRWRSGVRSGSLISEGRVGRDRGER